MYRVHAAADLENRGFAGPALQHSLQFASSFSSVGLSLQLFQNPLGTAQADALLPRLLNALLQGLDAQSPLCPEGLMVCHSGACTS